MPALSDPTRVTTPEATAQVAISISDVIWTTAIDVDTHEPQGSVTQYPNNAPTIIAAVQIEPVPVKTTLTATWAIDGAEVSDATMTVTSESDLQSAWATFQFVQEDGHLFPLGDLTVEITVNHGSPVSGEVEIVLPPA